MDQCVLCKKKERNEVKYGEFMTREDVSVHYFCLLLTSNLLQRGRDDQGFLGFLINDIKAEAIRVAPAVCYYCKRKSANISCCAPKCRRTFHLTCGVQNCAENQFVGTFKSYCDRHVSGKKGPRPPPKETCCICYENLIGEGAKYSCVAVLRAPCCKNGWFHKWCLAAFAKSAGYFFKCPLCNDNKVFRQRLVYRGVFIPDRDAAWELEPNAFAELLERPNECSARDCDVKDGRTSSTGRNKLLLCGTCGSVAIHRRCMKKQADNFYCDDCTIVIAAVNDASIVNISASQNTTSDEEEDIDVCEEDDDALVLSNSRTQDSDEDEGTVQPLGRVKMNGHDIFDDVMSDGGNSDNEDDTIFERKVRRGVKRILSSDIENSDVSVRNRVASRDAESLFDSGAESDRSGSSGDKFNTKNSLDIPTKNSLDIPTTECNASEKLENQANQEIKLNQIENLNKTKKRVRKFISLNDSPSENRCIRASTRRQSVCAETYLNSLKTVEDAKCCQPILKRRNSALNTFAFVKNDSETEETKVEISATLAKTEPHLQQETCNEVKINRKRIEFGTYCFKNETRRDDGSPKNSCIAHRTRRRSLNLNFESKNLITKLKARPRTNSEDPTQSSPALQRIRRHSFLQSPYSTPPQQGHRRGSSTEFLTLIANKRSRSDSMSGDGTTQNKRHKNNSTPSENENEYHGPDMTRGRRPSRGRSPLTSNLCSLYAFITPTYVKKKEPQREDTSSITGLLLNEPVVPEVSQFFSKDKSNIPQLKNVEAAKSTVKIESNSTSTSTVKQNRSAQETFLQSYSLLIHTPGKSKPHKPRNKRISHNFSNQNLPCNQTRIESFFKRI